MGQLQSRENKQTIHNNNDKTLQQQAILPIN